MAAEVGEPLPIGCIEHRDAVARQRVVHVQSVAVLVAGLGHERHRATLLERDLAQHLFDPDDAVACGDRICRVDVELELTGCRFVMPALDRHTQAVEAIQCHVDEAQLLARVVVQVAERRWMRHRGEPTHLLGPGLRIGLSEQHDLDLEGRLRCKSVARQSLRDFAQLRPRTNGNRFAIEIDDVTDDVGGSGSVGRRDERGQVGALMEIPEGLATPVVPPDQERRAADVVAEHELGDRVPEWKR